MKIRQYLRCEQFRIMTHWGGEENDRKIRDKNIAVRPMFADRRVTVPRIARPVIFLSQIFLSFLSRPMSSLNSPRFTFLFRWRWAVFFVLCVAVAATAVAQRGYRRSEFRTEYVDRGNLPVWKTDERFKGDLFTFVRIRYSSYGGGWGGGWGGGNWATDYPDSDLNFSYRLHELTALEVDPHGKILDL